MPKPTFFNLPQEKRAHFLAVALEEFADRDYAEASVSRLVTRAGIAKGSVYQYFQDKQDLFIYLVEHAQGVMLGTVRAVAERAGATTGIGLLAALRLQMSATIQAALAHPREARLIQRAHQAPLALRRKLERHDARVRVDHMRQLMAAAQARGELAATHDPELIAHVIAGVVGGLGPLVMQRLGFDPERDAGVPVERLDPAILEPLFDQVIDLIAHGLAARTDDHKRA